MLSLSCYLVRAVCCRSMPAQLPCCCRTLWHFCQTKLGTAQQEAAPQAGRSLASYSWPAWLRAAISSRLSFTTRHSCARCCRQGQSVQQAVQQVSVTAALYQGPRSRREGARMTAVSRQRLER